MNAVDMGPPRAAHATSASMVRAEADHRKRCLECVEKGRYSDCYKLRRLLLEFTNAGACPRCGWPLSAYHDLGCPFEKPVGTNKESA